MESSKEKSIDQTLSRMEQMFTNPTRELFEDLFTKDCDYVTFEGRRLKGVEENFESHFKLSQMSIFRGVRLEGELISRRFINDTTAVVIMKGALIFRWQKKAAPSRMSINTTILVVEDGRWKVCSFQNTRIKKPGLLRRLFE